MKLRQPIRIDRSHPARRDVRRIARHLTDGRLAIVPTETQYALCGDATSGDAVKAARLLKGRRASQPFSVFLRGIDDLDNWGIDLPAYADVLARRYWPGPMTLVLPSRTRLARSLGSPGAIGVRVSPEPIICALLEAVQRPMLATSANPSGAILTVTQENRWFEQLTAAHPVLWVRPSRYIRRVGSSVVDCTGTRPKSLREGAIPEKEWRQILAEHAGKTRRQ